MTHEPTANDEAEGGPEVDATLPDATGIPVTDTPDALPPVHWPGEWDDETHIDLGGGMVVPLSELLDD